MPIVLVIVIRVTFFQGYITKRKISVIVGYFRTKIVCKGEGKAVIGQNVYSTNNIVATRLTLSG